MSRRQISAPRGPPRSLSAAARSRPGVRARRGAASQRRPRLVERGACLLEPAAHRPEQCMRGLGRDGDAVPTARPGSRRKGHWDGRMCLKAWVGGASIPSTSCSRHLAPNRRASGRMSGTWGKAAQRRTPGCPRGHQSIRNGMPPSFPRPRPNRPRGPQGTRSGSRGRARGRGAPGRSLATAAAFAATAVPGAAPGAKKAAKSLPDVQGHPATAARAAPFAAPGGQGPPLARGTQGRESAACPLSTRSIGRQRDNPVAQPAVEPSAPPVLPNAGRRPCRAGAYLRGGAAGTRPRMQSHRERCTASGALSASVGVGRGGRLGAARSADPLSLYGPPGGALHGGAQGGAEVRRPPATRVL